MLYVGNLSTIVYRQKGLHQIGGIRHKKIMLMQKVKVLMGF
jgi:hypothetical protein